RIGGCWRGDSECFLHLPNWRDGPRFFALTGERYASPPRRRFFSMANPLAELAKVGQSVWYDQMERRLVTSGELQRMIDEDDLRGLTSNPTIFEKAISGSNDYDAQLRGLAAQNKSKEEIYDELTIEDIGNAADVF